MSDTEALTELNWFDSDFAGYRYSLENVDEAMWIGLTDAERLLVGCATPIQPPREFLIFRASMRSLASKAAEILETYPDGGQAIYRQIPIVEEWGTPAWSSPLADVWHDNRMRLPAKNGRTLEYRQVAFDRAAIIELASRWPPEQDGGGVIPNPVETLPKPRRGRPRGSGSLAADDAPLLIEMANLIDSRKARSVTAAADLVVDGAAGAGTRDNKLTRLRKAYLRSVKNGA